MIPLLPSRSATGYAHSRSRPFGPRSGLHRRAPPARCLLGNTIRNVSRLSSEGLSDAKREIHTPGALKPKLPGRGPVYRVSHDIRKAWKERWIQIVADVQTQRADGCLISRPQADGVGKVVVITFRLVVVEPGFNEAG